MFSTGRRQESFSTKNRAAKASFSKKRSSFKAGSSRRYEQVAQEQLAQAESANAPQVSPSLTSAIITLSVGAEQRLFAAHEEVISNSPFFAQLCQQKFYESNKRIDLPNEEPEIFSCVLEYLYKGDYYPRLEFNKRRNSWALQDAADAAARAGTTEVTMYDNGTPVRILRDTVIYCLADKYGLPELQHLALKKQGLQSGISCATILNSGRFAYAHTPDSDSRLRAHYLALIIRSRATFKRSGTMQMEMERGGRLFFDLFVAMVNHMDDLTKSP
ncbi:hypothetical protein BT63DRAFT_286506 [Microthyrium microscopicum]|uniref:BTB domain-containing protein n=1 Tax=Microthyrium microscopicum TaxID=703497 RepID=A0A6A6U977_9PEZI|nr:hypothetical protein BT63DRAFT_286506 [Microthyrium microscopicum]